MEEDDFHAEVVTAAARHAHENGDIQKAAEFVSSIVGHHWRSLGSTTALSYLVRGRHIPAVPANSGFENRT